MHETRKHAMLLFFFPVLSACGDNQTHVANGTPYDAGAPAPLACVPNLDGKIDANELTPAFGVTVNYRVSPAGKDRPVNVAGAVDAQGHTTWDYSVGLADDQNATLSAENITGKWYAASFPADAFTTPFDAGGTTEGVYRHDDTALWLYGIASKAAAPAEGKTLLVYTAPIELFKFPIAPGSTWTSVGEVKNGSIRGLPYAGRDTYDVKVDGAGMMILPDLTFTQALRVRTKVTLTPAAGAVTTQNQVSFLFECFGEVARATSKLNEPNDDFTVASEIRRLGLTR